MPILLYPNWMIRLYDRKRKKKMAQFLLNRRGVPFFCVFGGNFPLSVMHFFVCDIKISDVIIKTELCNQASNKIKTIVDSILPRYSN